MRKTIKVDVFAGEFGTTFTARILPLIRALGDYNVGCRIISPIAWNSIAKGKLGSVLSIALTHLPNSYADTLISARAPDCHVYRPQVVGRADDCKVRDAPDLFQEPAKRVSQVSAPRALSWLECYGSGDAKAVKFIDEHYDGPAASCNFFCGFKCLG